jgi:3'-phosphoadenosine 5'-phosphosulfate sulfotransferase (PAPS reductase)/FAD synthetase
MFDDVPAVFVNTGLEYPEIQNFVRNVKSGKYDCFNTDVEILRPEMQFAEVLKNYGYPVISKEVAGSIDEVKKARRRGRFDTLRDLQLQGKALAPDGTKSRFNNEKWSFLLDAPFDVSGKCCAVMKKKPFRNYEKQTKRKAYIGTMANESRVRLASWLRNGCNVFEGNHKQSRPLSFWTEQDVLHYIKKYDVPYASVYGDIVLREPVDTLNGQMNITDYLGFNAGDPLKTTGCDRTGCIFCMFGCHLESTPNRFERIKETHPKQYDYCINGGEMVNGKWQPNKEGLGLGYVLDYIGVKY